MKRFANKINKMQQGIRDDVIGDSIPYLTGTRTGFNFTSKAKTYRDSVLSSIAKHFPKEEEALPTDTGRSSTSVGRPMVPPSIRAQKEKIDKIHRYIFDNEAGKTVNGVSLKRPLVLNAIPIVDEDDAPLSSSPRGGFMVQSNGFKNSFDV